MPTIEIQLNLLLIPFIVIASALIGFALRSHHIKNLKMKVVSLENEMLQNHAEILTLQKEMAGTNRFSSESKTPVVNIKDNSLVEEKIVSKKHR